MITLKTLEQATAQEVFDQVAKHLLTQGERSLGPLVRRSGGSVNWCKYRGDNGLMCAAGCLIADDEYKPEFESQLWSRLVGEGLVPEAHRHLIRSLQIVHDDWNVEDWEESLRNVAEIFKLEFRGEMYANT